MSQIIDLDQLVPESRYVKIGDREVEIKPPKTVQMFKLGGLGQKMENANKLSPEEMETLVVEMDALIKEIAPELVGIELHASQVFKLIELIGSMVNGGQTETPKVEER